MSEREIVIRVRFPRWPRRRWRYVAAVCVVCLSGVVYATLAHPPFNSGDALSSSKLNDDLNGLDTRVTALEKKDGWTDIASGVGFSTGWSNYGNGYANAGFRKSPDGIVHLRGLVKGGANSSIIFTLPAGYIPSGNQRFIAANVAGANFVDVAPTGQVLFSGFANNSAWQSLDGISFLAEQ